MKIQNDVNLLRIVLKEPDKDFLTKIKSIDNPLWIVKRTADAVDIDKTFYLYKDLVDSKIVDILSELDTTRNVEFVENWKINLSTYSIDSNVIYGSNPLGEHEELDLSDVDFENEESLKLIDEKLSSFKPTEFDTAVEENSISSNEEPILQQQEQVEKESLTSSQKDFNELDGSLLDNQNLMLDENIIQENNVSLEKIKDIDLTKDELVETLIPNAENILEELTPTLELKTGFRDNYAILLKGQYEASLTSIHLMLSDSILSIDSKKLEKDIDKIKSAIETENLPNVREYFEIYEEKKNFINNLEAESKAIKDSYRARMDEYVNEITILAMRKFMEENPDDSLEKIALLYKKSEQKQHDLQTKSERMQSLAQKEVLSHILKTNKKDKALVDAMKFMTVKHTFQSKLDESIELLLAEEKVNNEKMQTLQLLHQIRDNQSKPQVIEKEVIKEVPVEAIKEETVKSTKEMANHDEILEEDAKLNSSDDAKKVTQLENSNIAVTTDADSNTNERNQDEIDISKTETPQYNAPIIQQNEDMSDDFGEADDFDESLFDEDSDGVVISEDNVVRNKGEKKSLKKKIFSKKGLIGLGVSLAIILGGSVGAYFAFGGSNKPQQTQQQENKNSENDEKNQNETSKDDAEKKSTEGDIVVGTVLNISHNGKQFEATVEKIEANGDVILHDKDGKKYKVSAAKLAEFKKNQEQNK